MALFAALRPAPEPRPEPDQEPENTAHDTSFVTETLPLATVGDARFAPGVGQTIARQDCMSLGVTNHGSGDLIVCNSPADDKPPGFIGPGVAIVAPGTFAMLTMPGRIHSYYGRPGELVGVTRFPDWQPGVVHYGPGLWFPVDLGIVGATIDPAYTTPWGTAAVYGGFTARETVGTSPVAFQIRDGSATGTVLDDVNLGAGGSTEEDTTYTRCTTPRLAVVFVGGGGTLRLTLRVR
jgi:hypothetical protein